MRFDLFELVVKAELWKMLLSQHFRNCEESWWVHAWFLRVLSSFLFAPKEGNASCALRVCLPFRWDWINNTGLVWFIIMLCFYKFVTNNTFICHDTKAYIFVIQIIWPILFCNICLNVKWSFLQHSIQFWYSDGYLSVFYLKLLSCHFNIWS